MTTQLAARLQRSGFTLFLLTLLCVFMPAVQAQAAGLLPGSRVTAVFSPGPTNLVATARDGDVSLYWTGVPTASGYNIYRSTVSGSGYVKVNAVPTPDLTYEDEAVANGPNYYYVVTAIVGGIESVYSDEDSAQPVAAFNLSAVSTGAGKITLYWNDPISVPNNTGYNIYRGTASGTENYTHPVNGAVPVTALSDKNSNAHFFTDTGLTNGKQYFYTVAAVTHLGQIALSNEDSDYVDPGAIPWDTRDPSKILSAVVSLSSEPLDPAFDVIRVIGPDGSIYDNEASRIKVASRASLKRGNLYLRSKTTQTNGLVADNRVRSLVMNIHAGQISSLQLIDLLHGPSVPTMPTSGVDLYPYFAPTVTDRRLIAHFLRALRHAYKQEGFMPALATPSLQITFKKTGRYGRDPLDIDINFEYFGPEFQSVLNTVPSYLAAQLHDRMQMLDGQVRVVDFAAFKVTDPQKIARITRALKQVKPVAFSVYGSTDDTFGLRLRLRHGRSEDVVFVLEHSDVSRLGSAMLPEPLWSCYKLVRRVKKASR